MIRGNSILCAECLTDVQRQQLAQDDEGFEIASYGGSLDEEEAGEPTDPDRGVKHPDRANGGVSPLPKAALSDATASFNERGKRPSLEGETIFAVGEEEGDAEGWSDDELRKGDGEERERLTRMGN